MRKNSIVYQFFYPAAHRRCGLPCYVGKGKESRPKDHVKNSHNKQLRGLFDRYSELPLLIVRHGLSDEEASKIEVALIKAIGRIDKGEGPLLNHTDGGEGVAGHIHSIAVKKRVGELSKNMWADPDKRAAIVTAQNAGRATPEYRAKRKQISQKVFSNPAVIAKMSASATKRFQDPEERRRTGRLTSLAMARPEVSAAVSVAQKERFTRPEEIEKRRQHTLGRKASTETRKKMSISMSAYLSNPENQAKRKATFAKPEVREAMSVGQKRRLSFCPEELDRIRQLRLGSKASSETRKKMSDAHIKIYSDPERRAAHKERMRLWWEERRKTAVSTER